MNQKFADQVEQVFDHLDGPVILILVIAFGGSIISLLATVWLMLLGKVSFDGVTFLALLAFGMVAVASYLLIKREK